MTKRKVSADAKPGVTKYPEYEDTSKSYVRTIRRGDSITANVPWTKAKRTTVTFNYYVVPERGVPYIEVVDNIGLTHCIRPEAIDSKKRKRKGAKH